MGENDALDLQAHECAPDDVGRGRARIGREMRAKLGVEVGDVVDLRGSKGTVAVVARGLKRDSGKAVVRLDWATRRNAGVSLRESVRVAKASAVSAEEVELEPEDAKIYTLLTSVTEYERMREWLKGRALVLGDTVVLRREEDDLEEVALRVVDSKPAGALRIGDSTRLRLRSPPRRRIETPEQDRTGRVEVRRGRRDGTVVVAKVAEAMQSDVTLGRVRLNTETRMALNVEVGDIIEVKGRRSTPVRVFRTLQEDEDKAIVRIDGLTRKNAGVSIGDRVEVLRADAKPAERVVLAPVMENDYKIRFGHGTEEFVRRGLLKRPVAQGDALVIPGIALMSGYLPFIAVKTQPRGIVQIVESTDIVIKDEPVKDTDCVRRDETSADIGGLTAVRERVDHMISTLFTNPEVAGRAGVSPSPYLLLVGQSGCGKRSLVSSLARERGVEVRELRFAAFMMKTHSLAEAYLWDQVTSLNEAASSLLLIDDIDQIAPRVGEDGPEGRRVLAILISSHLDLLRRDRPVMVVGLAERLDAIDPDLLRPGRFEQVLHVPPPGPGDRRAILAVHLAGMALDESPPELWERAVAEVSQATGGFVGADLKLLCDEAGMLAISRISPSVDPDEPVPEAVLERLRITPQDLRDAAARVTPAVRRMAGPRSPPPGPAPDAPAPP